MLRHKKKPVNSTGTLYSRDVSTRNTHASYRAGYKASYRVSQRAGYKDRSAFMIYIYILFLVFVFVREFIWV